MDVEIQTHRDGESVRLVAAGPLDLAHGMAVLAAVGHAEASVRGCDSIALDVTGVARMDGMGAVLLAGLLERLEAAGIRTQVTGAADARITRLIELYRGRRTEPPTKTPRGSVLERIGAGAAHAPDTVRNVLDFIGRVTRATPRAVTAPRSVDWQSLPRLLQEVGADSLAVASAANLLVGFIMGVLGVSQLARFGAVAFVPELVIVSQFRELGPLVTAIVVAGRSGAGVAAELATMKVSEEVDALQAMGVDPIGWLVLPRTLAMVVALPLLTWIGDIVAIAGGYLGTTGLTDMTGHAYLTATSQAITAAHLVAGLAKTPALALSIALIACYQGLAARGGAAAVGGRTTKAVVMAILGVIAMNALFTLFYAAAGW